MYAWHEFIEIGGLWPVECRFARDSGRSGAKEKPRWLYRSHREFLISLYFGAGSNVSACRRRNQKFRVMLVFHGAMFVPRFAARRTKMSPARLGVPLRKGAKAPE
jgi:hypothetical protein